MKRPNSGSSRTFPHWIFPFFLALGGYFGLGLYCLREGRLPLSVWWSVQGVGWISCGWFLYTSRSRGWPAIPWIIATALLFRVCGLWATPSLEDDYQRYLWDGWRTIQDGSPFARAPLEYFGAQEKRPPGIETALNELNHPGLTTIYAPVTQLLFAGAAKVAPGSLFTLKFFLLLVDGALLGLLAVFGGRAAAWFYGWCPLVVTENAFHAHPDGWALLWLIAAWVCARRERYLIAGVLAGVAVSAKLFAVLGVPFLAWRRPLLFAAACLSALGMIYGPILASGSFAEWDGLRAMARSFEFNSLGFAMLAHFCGEEPARVLWLLLFFLIAGFLFARWVGRSANLVDAPIGDVLLAFLLLGPVLNPWYAVWIVPFVALAPTRPAVALLIVVPLSYATGLNLGDPSLANYAQPLWVRPVEFGIVLLAALTGFWQRPRPPSVRG